MYIVALVALLTAGLQAATPTAFVSSASVYEMTVLVNPEQRRIEVTGTWHMPAQAIDRADIEFLLSPRMEELSVRLVEPAIAGALRLKSRVEDGGDIRWVFTAPAPIPSGTVVTLQFSYRSDGKAAPQFNVEPAGSFAGGSGELWYPQASFKGRETGTLDYQVRAGDRVISNGTRAGDAAEEARGRFRFRVDQPSKFAFAAGPYTAMRRDGRVTFTLHLLRPRARAQEILDGAARALDHLTDLFGPFPYGEFSLVEVRFPTVVAGTSEFGFILSDDSKLDDVDLSYWAHEIGHQWWGNLVAGASGTAGQMMLSEGITQFGALSAVEAVLGPAAAARLRRENAALYFAVALAGKDLPLTTHVPQGEETLSMHRLANSKGFVVLDMLARLVGPERLARSLRDFVNANANRTTSWAALQHAIEAGAGADIRWFFDDWLERPGAPAFDLSWQQRGEIVTGAIVQDASVFRGAIEVRLEGEGRSETVHVDVAGARVPFEVRVPFRVTSVVLDPDFKVFRWLPEFLAKRQNPGQPAAAAR